jgi:hypothetical protein
MQAKLKTTFNPIQRSEILACFTALTAEGFNTSYDILRINNSDAWEYLDALERDAWASYTFVQTGNRTYGVVDNNLSESENNCLLRARNIPTLLETFIEICRIVQEVIVEHQKMAQRPVTPGQTIVEQISACVDYFASNYNSFVVHVADYQYNRYRVNLASSLMFTQWWNVDFSTNQCSCGEWQDQGYPCKHAYVCFLSKMKGKNAWFFESAFDPIYRIENVRRALEISFTIPLVPVVQADAVPLYTAAEAAQAAPRLGRPSKQRRFLSQGE